MRVFKQTGSGNNLNIDPILNISVSLLVPSENLSIFVRLIFKIN